MRARPELRMFVASGSLRSLEACSPRDKYLRQNLYPWAKHCSAIAVVMMVFESKPGTKGAADSTWPGRLMVFLASG
jgi:hypothetical protein